MRKRFSLRRQGNCDKLVSRFERMSDVVSILQENGFHFRDANSWRLVNPTLRGQINGLPHSSGRLVATNGVLCLIERHKQPALLGHIDSFVKDKEQFNNKLKEARKAKVDLLLVDLFDL